MYHPPYSPHLAPSDFHLFLHIKKFLGGKRFDDGDDLKVAVQKWPTSMRRVHNKIVPATISASIMAAKMWKNSLKNVESVNNKIFTKSYSIFLHRNGTYFLNEPRST